jgi:hypothetical protein
MTVYATLRFLHLAGLGLFLFGHGVTGATSLVLRGPVSGATRTLLQMSQRAAAIYYPGILLVIVTGVWMAFLNHSWSMGWPWAAVVIVVVTFAAMFYVSRPYYLARDAAKGSDDGVLAERLKAARPMLALWVGVIALVLLLWLMVFKPF